MSVEDLSSHSSDFSHIKKRLDAAGHKLYLPSVVQPSQLQHDLIREGYEVMTPATVIFFTYYWQNTAYLVSH